MSNIYQQQPPTSGKVILITTIGDIDIEIWANETPKTCRNFIQLCLEGYYDNTIFHRLIPKFIIQGGDPTNTGTGGESIYGGTFQDEFHQRLKFSHRGILGMVNEEGKPNSNRSQFFITFDQCSWLDKKNTVFGKVTGNSIYNLMNLQELQTDKNDRPINPPKIIKTKVVVNPFQDITVRKDEEIYKEVENLNNKKEEKITQIKKNQIQKKNLLSFQEEEQEEEDFEKEEDQEQEQFQEKKRFQIFMIQYKMRNQVNNQSLIQMNSKKKKRRIKKKQLQQKIKQVENNNEDEYDNVDNNNNQLYKEDVIQKNFLFKKIKKQVLNLLKKIKIQPLIKPEEIKKLEKKIREQQKNEYENLKITHLKQKREQIGTNSSEFQKQLKENKKLLSSLEQRKQRFLQDQKNQQHEGNYMKRLQEFKKQLNNEQGKNNWLNHKLKFQVTAARAFQDMETKQKVVDFDVNQYQESSKMQEFRQIKQYIPQEKKRNEILSVDELIKMSEK
ncbi:peptidyl-prolyl cis-trans cyclophilin-type family protein, putative [Ichthyophthirius multifiliis]|uniref:Peptidyl-prolyl cis-trans cyclophilin-type family protein, putative n=1 Tax=Ichthyophthirius multifiliis TaxID=5932 RepID=G0R1W4_ICHMU|nr:peptidyl-prolyl cis-trans cyclophilin-type family protein, putative [Ichthyophthirius multifiliis]EGR28537.1 peptidyl-prolyl cis-trans cyclophilin-type family protein, putative [Ichthyophthirius multifiliis]|eukprot:XP_004029773.1 peptidyl-prolyl cis-trans cyclophilin-type family protein, putative [Ichthyophthirius multifiliis]